MNLRVKGLKKLKGVVEIDGSKNASLAIIASSILCDYVVLRNVSDILDINNMLDIIKDLGSKVIKKDDLVIIENNIKNKPVVYKNLRASYYFLGAMLAKFGEANIPLPGGCNLKRDINYHIDGLIDLGYEVSISDRIKAKKTAINKEITLRGKSVGATINLILASLNSNFEIKIFNTLIEPEVSDFIKFLNKMGYIVELIKNGVKITPSSVCKSVEYDIMPDRLEVITFIALGLLNGKLIIRNFNYKHISKIIEFLVLHGAKIKVTNEIYVKKSKLDKMDVILNRYPCFPTDLNPIFLALILLNNGGSINDYVFPDRLGMIKAINKNIDISNIKKQTFKNLDVEGTDLRCDMGLLLLALSSKGVHRLKLDNINRGYSNIIKKLKNIKASIIEV